VRQQIVVRTDRLEIPEQVERILAVDFERVVLAERQGLTVESEFQLNSTPCSSSTAQNRSSGLRSGVTANLLDPEGRPLRTLGATSALGRRYAHVRANQ